MFSRSNSVSAWSQVARLNAVDAAPNDLFGFSVALDLSHMVVGAYGDDYNELSDSGSALYLHKIEVMGSCVSLQALFTYSVWPPNYFRASCCRGVLATEVISALPWLLSLGWS